MLNVRIAALAAACSIALAGCAGQTQLTSPNDAALATAVGQVNATAVAASPSLANVENKISAALVNACGWEPAASTLTNLAATISGNGTASAIAAAITGLTRATCKAVTAPASNGVGLLDRAPVPVYRGVNLVGKFMK